MRRQSPPGRPHPWCPGKTAAYHITHISNLAGMAQAGVIWSHADCKRAGVRPVSIAHSNLKDWRATQVVTHAHGGTLANYVPFYFAPRSPMLYAIARNAVAGYEEGQDPIAHLVVAVEDVAVPGLFVITDGHPVMEISCQFGDLRALDSQIDWKVMYSRYWRDDDRDGDRKRRRQAEFLV